jgi:mRNA-degrading endonuclease RelE of RelBE toxin-antitoxin system
MPKPATPQPIKICKGPRYRADLKKLSKSHPTVAADVQAELDKVIIPAVQRNPLAPHEEGAGTPIVLGVLNARVQNSGGAEGQSGAFRLTYHWNRLDPTVTLLAITLRRDAQSFTRKALARLINDARKE